MRARTITVLLLGVLAALLSPVGAANAATPLTATITCDRTANTISARLSGNASTMPAGRAVIVDFTVLTGSSVTIGGTSAALPDVGRRLASVPATVGSDWSLNVDGYTKPWNAADYSFYTETVRVSLRAPTGEQLGNRTDGTCTYDTRTQLALTCDPATNTFAARLEGENFTPGQPLKVRYYNKPVFQATADGIRWTTTPYLTAEQDFTPSADGTWVNTAYAETVTPHYYLSYDVRADVTERQTGRIVARATAYCLYTAP
ncbi:hypothetical protein E1293_34685 [Actinomadura darangshiensis]|uniref:Uncharacterized protein n=1 Tax=Actinomadura darangshiensis TaxID=705336 RepID=A0A4R5AHZ3_9ACTN|nr:hypothetical protein [Actinomadura darangshiensis]TDD70564.1 hypothetical protein E1293_34685 [Actinomadura darangshiensis]